jgi:hypothetical protein
MIPKEIDIKLKIPVRNQSKNGSLINPVNIQSYMSSEDHDIINIQTGNKLTEDSVNEKVR